MNYLNHSYYGDSPLTTKSTATEMLSTLVCTAHVYFPACLSWTFRIIMSPAECCCHSMHAQSSAQTHTQAQEFRKQPAIVIPIQHSLFLQPRGNKGSQTESLFSYLQKGIHISTLPLSIFILKKHKEIPLYTMCAPCICFIPVITEMYLL